ncbi:hypothetical protein [Mongoliitalea lutea]|uniref:Uncharacterized protein n=1 Tax=Mongoliitalea lutea TaxID=849756 RepID=A0A8J3G637_9BACT|nr:hypothetical protein [Mongoliitalea lutea]GHB44618.1 hypothetical protein GCM10008106_27120 [Mongoliitalea lutea]
MENLTIQTKAQLATSIKELMDPMTGKRRLGMVYFQRLEDGGLIARSVSLETDPDSVKQMIRNQKIYIPTKTIIAETK